LHYYLPAGLVGGEIEVTMTGAVPNQMTSSYNLSGPLGTTTCAVRNSTWLSCSASYTGLPALPIDIEVVRSTAAAHGDDIDHRQGVSAIYGRDPEGTLDFDPTASNN